MTRKEQQLLKSLIAHLRKAQELADTLEICVGNGGEVSSIVGSMADELEVRRDALDAA